MHVCVFAQMMFTSGMKTLEIQFQMIPDVSDAISVKKCVRLVPLLSVAILLRPEKNASWSKEYIYRIIRQSATGGIVLTGMGSDRPHKDYFQHMLLNAAQVTNPSIDPLREPMELKTFIGRKPDMADMDTLNKKNTTIDDILSGLLELEIPIMFSAMSFGSISLNACRSLAEAAKICKTYWNTGEGGMHQSLYPYADRAIVQIASGRFGVNVEYLNRAAAVEIKIGQGAKTGYRWAFTG